MTIKNLILAALTSILVLMTGQKAYSMHHEKKEQQSATATERKKINEELKSSLTKIFEQNEKIHAAFFTYNADEVEKSALVLRDLILKVSDQQIKNDFKRTLVQLEKLTKTNDQEANNHLYNLVSKKLVDVLTKYDLGKTYNVYSCPMVKKVWVQNSVKMDKVHNPYASYMPHCGTKDTNF